MAEDRFGDLAEHVAPVTKRRLDLDSDVGGVWVERLFLHATHEHTSERKMLVPGLRGGAGTTGTTRPHRRSSAGAWG
jgi:hypothetical protein